jgi:mannose-6-phosphate isomerase
VFLLHPFLKDALWGGCNLFKRFRKGADERIAESWELSTHADGHSRISDGRTLQELLSIKPSLSGGSANQDGTIPILAKLIDACLPLSVQVHPDDDSACSCDGDSGKTEFWYVLDAEPDAWIYYGLSETITHDQFEKYALDGTIESVLQKVPVKAGDAFFIPAGTLHSLGGGILCFELQQNSNLTYRVFDYDRRDHTGRTRTLHIQQALDVVTLTPTPRYIPGEGESSRENGLTRRTMVCCSKFSMEEMNIDGEGKITVPNQLFAGLFFVEGKCLAVSSQYEEMEAVDCELSLMPGQTVFLASGETVILQGRGRAFLLFPPTADRTSV